MAQAQSTVGISWAYSNKRQSAYATPNPNADIDQTHPFVNADIGDHAPNMVDNAGMFGKGHEFTTRNDMLTWDTMFRRQFLATSKILGWAWAFHLGKLTTTGLGGVPAAYSHLMEYQDPNGTGYYGSGRQQPVMTIMERTTSALLRRFPSMQIRAVEITGQIGEFLNAQVELQGSGMMSRLAPSSYTFPDQSTSEGERLRFSAATILHGPSGAPTDVSCDIRSFRFRSEYQYFDQDGYCPGSGYFIPGDPTSGQIRNKLEFARRSVVLEMTVRGGDSNAYFEDLEGQVELYTSFNFEGATISGANRHRLLLVVPRSNYRAVPIQTDGDLITFQLQTIVFYDAALENPFEVTVTNDTATYLVSS